MYKAIYTRSDGMVYCDFISHMEREEAENHAANYFVMFDAPNGFDATWIIIPCNDGN